jgi:hypothetical protein
VLTLVAFVSSAMAVVVNVDCQYNDGDYDHYTYSGTAAAPDAGTVWNQLDIPNKAITGALASDGSPTSINITAENTIGAYTALNAGNDLLNDYWFDNTMVAKTITISGLVPNTEYTLYMYGNETNVFGASEGCTFTFNGVTQTALGAQTVPIPPNPWVLGYDHVIFNLTSDAGGEIVGTYGGNGAYNRWNGMQIEGIPEPATMCLFGLGALGLLRRKRS